MCAFPEQKKRLSLKENIVDFAPCVFDDQSKDDLHSCLCFNLKICVFWLPLVSGLNSLGQAKR